MNTIHERICTAVWTHFRGASTFSSCTVQPRNGEAEVKKRRPRMRADPHLSDSPGEIANIAVETRAPTTRNTRANTSKHARQHVPPREKTFPSPISISSARSVTN